MLLCCARGPLDDPRAEGLAALVRAGVDWEWLVGAARAHGMLPLLYRHLRPFPDAVPAPVLAALRDGFHVSARQGLRLTGEMLRLLPWLATNQVVAIPYKGAVLAARYYGDVALRPFRDLDFLVQPRDLARAERALAAKGYRPMRELSRRQEQAVRGSTCEYAFARDGDIVELHSAFGPRDFPLPVKLKQVATRLEPVTVGTVPVRTLASEDLMLVLCAHGAKHFWERLEWICDVAQLLRRTPQLDLGRVLGQARAAGAERMVLLGLRLAAELLEAPLPDHVHPRVLADHAVAALAEQVRARLFHHTPGTQPNTWELRLFLVRARERWRDRLRSWAHAALTPTQVDWTWLPLPDLLYPLYYVTRPIRLMLKYGRRTRQRS